MACPYLILILNMLHGIVVDKKNSKNVCVIDNMCLVLMECADGISTRRIFLVKTIISNIIRLVHNLYMRDRCLIFFKQIQGSLRIGYVEIHFKQK